MSRLISFVVAAFFAVLFGVATASAQSEAKFPAEWKSWPVTASGKLTGTDTPIPADAPAILRDTLKAYGWVNNGKGSAYEVRVNPKAMDVYTARNGKFADGPTAVLVLTDINALLVTEHLLGQAAYGAFAADGKDLSSAHPSLAVQTCKTCHTGYADLCIGGVCSSKRN